jgi:hypothetical protein
MADRSKAMQDEAFSQERWAFECRMRERELALQERRLEHEMKSGVKKDSWASPLVVAVLAAAVAAAGNAIVSYVEGEQSRELEAFQAEQTRVLEAERAEYARIQEMLETGDPDTAAENLRFLIAVGLVTDEAMRDRLNSFLEERAPGEGPALASKVPTPALAQLPPLPPGTLSAFTPPDMLPFPVHEIQRALAASGLCGDNPRLQDGMFGTMTRMCLTQYLTILPMETIGIASFAPEKIREWVEQGGAPADWQQQIEELREN